jgi:tetratricopeptide (TPR) repeat protein
MNCLSCGAIIFIHDKGCKYCGTTNPEYRPQDSEINALLEKGQNAHHNEHYAEAIDCYNRALDIDPNAFEVYFYLAASYSLLKRNEEAIKAMEKAQRLRPDNAPIYYNLGMLHKQIGRKMEAKKYFEKALEAAEKDLSDTDHSDFIQMVKKRLGEYKRWKLF